VGILFGFAPWIVYWLLVGNVPFQAAAVVALAVAVAGLALARGARKPAGTLEIGSIAVLFVLAVLTFALSEPSMERWLPALGNTGIFVVALVGVLVGKPFTREYVAAEQPADVVKTELFEQMARVLTWLWVGVFAAMAVSSLIPPIVDRNASLLDTKTPLSYVFYWIVPFALFGTAAVVSRFVPERMLAGIDDVARETSFVAYDEATIDELYYLAQEHANREVGPGKEAYSVKVGGMGTPLTGDESRKSWPSTYKVRDRKG
jgi:intracellular septation protein A